MSDASMADDKRAPGDGAPRARLDASALAAQVGLKLRFAQAAVWGDLVAAFRPFGLRPQHYAAMSMIATAPGCRQQQIGAALRMSSSNVVGLIDELVGAGLVDRREMPTDRRSNALTLTASGAALLERMDEAQARHEAWLATALTAAERHELMRLLDKLAAL